jgi:RNA polymerase sigma factor (sigma-70 family)
LAEWARLAERTVEKARGGDLAAYERLVRAHQQVAFRTAYAITGDAAEAEDAAQEGFVKAYRALDGFRPGAPFRPWLLAIVANEARNRRKAAGRRASLALRAADEGRSPSDPSPEATAVAGERRTELLAALNGMAEEDRRVITYRYFLDLTEEEMASVLDCARGTVKSRLSRALARLRETMTEEKDAR